MAYVGFEAYTVINLLSALGDLTWVHMSTLLGQHSSKKITTSAFLFIADLRISEHTSKDDTQQQR